MEGFAYKFLLAVARRTRRPPLAVPRARGTSLRSSFPHVKRAGVLLRSHKIEPRLSRVYFVDFVRVQWNQIIAELQQWQQLQVDAKLALAA